MKSSPKGNMQENKEGVLDDKDSAGVIICTRNLQLTICPLFFQSFYIDN